MMRAMRPAPKHDTTHILSDFTTQIAKQWKSACPCASGSFGNVYRFTIKTNKGTTDVAVKVLNIDPRRAVEKYEKALLRELRVWLRLSNHQTIVPLLGTANVGSPCPALILKWMPSGTLCMYLEKQGTTTALVKAKLVRGVADGVRYLHSENVVHGDLHSANILIDDAGNPRLTDFGLATIVGDAESQLNTTTAGRHFNPQWRAPEIIGIDPEADLVPPNFKSDIYSFGGIMFFIVSGDKPWKEKKNPAHIIIELSKKATPARPDNILDDHWNLIQKCWSWNPDDRPKATEVIRCLATKITPILGRAEIPESTIRTIPPETAESTLLPPTMTARVKHGTISSFDTTILPDCSPRRSSSDSSSPFDDSPNDAQNGFDVTEGSSPILQNAYQDLPMATTDAQLLRNRFGRFRILIVGRANAGKTTILQKICNATDVPEIYNTKGNKIDVAVVKPTIKRGYHDITNEMVFKSNSDFVFHDSRSFEAGSAEEFEKMMKFISERVHATKLEERIHAIWYCIPMDDPSRTFQSSEEKFFSKCNIGQIPVVVIFTKFETLRPLAYGEIKKELKGLSAEELSQRITQRVEELFLRTGVWDRLCDAKNRTRPKCYIRLENMNKPNANCDALLETTTLALDDEELRLCLMLTQQSNMELCIKYAVGPLVERAVESARWLLGRSQMDYEVCQFDIAKWFSHLKLLGGHDVPDFNHNLFNGTHTWKRNITRVLEPLIAKGSLFTAANGIIQTGVATIIVLEYSAFLPNKGNFLLENVESAVDYYLKSPTAVVVEKGVKEICRQGYDREELGKKIVQFILDNRMSRDLTAKK